MISRALFIALFSAYATSLTPLKPLTSNSNDDCALYLTGPGRSSAYDYSLNLLKGNFAYDGQHTCITYDAINQAYLDARSRILVSQPKGDWHAEDFASVGELVLDISINLARTYGLTYEEIEKGLPLIDTSRTLIREVCPPVFSHVECRAGKYRRFDGLCNNLQHPTWGATMAPFQRLIGPLFADGINAPRIAHTGRDLPLSRVVSRTMHPDDGFHDHAGTVMVIAWGQFMDHDYTLTGTPLDPLNRNDPEECCKRPPHLKHPYCNEIRVPDDDYFYRLFGVKCIDFVRGFPSPRPGCKLGSRVPFNTLTGTIDGNTVYGVTEKFSRKLRTGYGGLLRMNPVFKEYGLKDLLPLKLDIPDEGCTRPNKNMYCFEAGEIRVNEQLVLAVMHTLMAREHNRVAKGLAEVNPHWDDETLFQEARRINIAEIQHITYNEFLPILLGKDVMEKFGLVLEKEGYWDGYDPEVNPDVIDSFASAAYRFGHSLLPTAVERWSKAHKFIASKRLSDLIRRPYDLYRAGVLDEYVMGLMNQVAQAMDDSITQEVTNHLFKKVGARFGMDLVSFNMQRGREFGIPGYMEFRKFCGLSDAHNFQDLFGSMPNETLRKYETIFEHPIDIDLWSGGVSERPLRGSMLGPTFACIIATQFSYSRRGDRFWFELPNQPSSFTREQLTEIRKSRLARVICDNTDIIDTVQLYPMVLPDHELNPRVPCRSGIIPSMDFSKWAEPVPFAGAAKQYITGAKLVNSTHLNTPENEATFMNITQLIKENIIINSTQKETFNKTLFKNKDNNFNTGNNHLNTASKEENNNKTGIMSKKTKKYNDIKQVLEKRTGHPKNMLRKKRSTPLVYNYVTNHGPDSNVKLEDGGILSNSNLADFKIETLHKPLKHIDYSKDSYNNVRTPHIISSEEGNLKNDSLIKNKYHKKQDNFENNDQNSYDISEHDSKRELKKNKHTTEVHEEPHTKTKKSFSELNESVSIENKASEEIYEKPDTKKEPSIENNNSTEDEDSSEILHKIYTNKNEAPSESNSFERNSSEEIHPISKNQDNNSDSDHSIEKEPYENQKSKYKQRSSENSEEATLNSNSNESLEASIEKGSRDEIHKPVINTNSEYNESSDENNESNESLEHLEQDKLKENNIGRYNNGVNSEKENYNIKKSQNESANYRATTIDTEEIDDNIDYDSYKTKQNIDESTEQLNDFDIHSPVPITVKPYDKNDLPVLPYDVFNSSLQRNSSNLRNINDEEVKPVIELNNEDFSDESSEGNLKLPLSVKKAVNKGSENNNEVNEGINLKQQIERIPLNYKHTSAENKNVESEEYVPEDTISEEGPSSTTAPVTDTDKFDENLNIKFGDISIKLPEIKLPDDILAYNYEEPVYKKSKSINSHNEEESDEEQTNNDNTSYEQIDGHNNYHDSFRESNKNKNSHTSNEEDNDDNEDLYEKFVRERFGKQKSDIRNSKYIMPDKQLFNTLQNVLRKTEKIHQEAEKSGDPNAGYAWTLEYGQKL